MLFDQLFHDGQAQSRPALRPCRRRIGLPEPIEYITQEIRADFHKIKSPAASFLAGLIHSCLIADAFSRSPLGSRLGHKDRSESDLSFLIGLDQIRWVSVEAGEFCTSPFI